MTVYQRSISCLSLASLLVVAQLVAGCRDLPATGANQQVPVANAGPDQNIAVVGETTVTLDGRKSSDADGEVVRYYWLSADAATGDEAEEILAEGFDAGIGLVRSRQDLEESPQPTVTLGKGVWTFTLWVEDDEGLISDPDSVTIIVSEDGSDPRVPECVAGVVDTVSDSCAQCVCSLGDTCRAAATACGELCWALMECSEQMCADAEDLGTCVGTMCFDFLEGAGASRSAGACRAQCPEECAVAP